MKTGIKVFVIGLFMLLAGQAQAAVNTYTTVNDILMPSSPFLSAESPAALSADVKLSGLFDFIYVGSEAADTNKLIELVGGSGNKVIFNNKSNDNDTSYSLNIETLFAKGQSTKNEVFAINAWSEAIHVYLLKSDVSINNVFLTAGSYLFGFNDGGSPDADFDDLVFAAKTSSVPLPGAAILFGSGLLGLVGLRRREIV
ncbi:MAG: hypothetical protein CVU60_03190 [Deltaproteobacteria bacterium HGW-Deltaproteobacteria-18]|jgi:hypothetical protein|nr:MAG: hypothetical protein CVU60_03190 [Deltaproteobacteria bacterium HGW-Deltaproteobacteria-18]